MFYYYIGLLKYFRKLFIDKDNMAYTTIDDLFKLIRGSNRYQITIVVIMFVIGYTTDFVFNEMPLLETLPIVDYNDTNTNSYINAITNTYNNNYTNTSNSTTEIKQITKQLNYHLCKTHNFTINKHLTKTYSWVYENNIYCDKNKVSFLSWCMVGGSFIGTLLSQLSNFYGTRKTIISGATLFIIGSATLLFETLDSLFLGNFILGLSNGLIFMTKNIIMTEIADEHSRVYFLGASLGGASFVTIIAYAFVDYNVNWRYYYYGHAGLCFTMLIVYVVFSVENPRFYLLCNDFFHYKK